MLQDDFAKTVMCKVGRNDSQTLKTDSVVSDRLSDFGPTQSDIYRVIDFAHYCAKRTVDHYIDRHWLFLNPCPH